jgi:hypothetical protein
LVVGFGVDSYGSRFGNRSKNAVKIRTRATSKPHPSDICRLPGQNQKKKSHLSDISEFFVDRAGT